MAEIVEYRVSRNEDELDLLVKFGIFEKHHAKEIHDKRERFEYVLRRRTRKKLDYLKYIRFEVNLLESIEKFRKTVFKQNSKSEDIDAKILLLQAKKLKDIIRSRCAHISALFRKLTTSYQFDQKLWLAYIDFAKGRKWNKRVSALYWRLLRVSSDDPKVWIAAAKHEADVNLAHDTARGLFLRALRQHPKSSEIWSEYFIMEYIFMANHLQDVNDGGYLPRVVYDEATAALDSENHRRLSARIMRFLAKKSSCPIKDHVQNDIQQRYNEDVLKSLAESSSSLSKPPKNVSNMERLYECYESKGVEETRKLYSELDRKNGTLSLYVAMVQVEQWKNPKDLTRIRPIFERALAKFGKTKPKLWYEYIQLEYENAKSLQDFERVNQIHSRALATLQPSKVDRVIEKYTMLQAGEHEYSDYSDLED